MERMEILNFFSYKIDELKKDLEDCKSNVTTLQEKLCSLLDCQNEGTCEEGVCQCQAGFEGAHCELVKGK